MSEAVRASTAAQAEEIGRIIEQVSAGTFPGGDTAAETAIESMIEHPGRSVSVDLIPESVTEKKVIKPDNSIVQTMKGQLTTAGARYPLNDEYISKVASIIQQDYDEATHGTLEQYIAFLADNAPTNEEFFYMRLGEYSVTQCM